MEEGENENTTSFGPDIVTCEGACDTIAEMSTSAVVSCTEASIGEIVKPECFVTPLHGCANVDAGSHNEATNGNISVCTWSCMIDT